MNDERIVCCLETWIKELKEGEDSDAAHWIIATYENEIMDGDYVTDDQFKKWLLNRKKK